MRLIDAEETKRNLANSEEVKFKYISDFNKLCAFIDSQPTVAASPWHRVEEELPKESGEYIVAYHPCYRKDVDTSVTKVGIDYFRGKSAWAKRKFQRVTHWMEKPEPPQEETK